MKFKINSNYVKWGLTVFLSGACLILFFFVARSVGNVMRIVPVLVKVLAPFIIGFVMAYILNPVYNALVRRIRFFLGKQRVEDLKATKIAKRCSLALTCIFFLAVIALLLYMVIPELVRTISDLVVTLPGTYETLSKWLQVKAEHYHIWELIGKMVANGNDKIMDWLTQKVLPASMTAMDGISNGIMGVIGVLSNLLIGFIAMIYMLASKDAFRAQATKLCYCIFTKPMAEKVMQGARNINVIFMRFVSSNLLDALIVGIICFIFMKIVGWPYAMLISVIIGVTNMIPFFGPFIGGIPSAALLMTANPIYALYFAIFIVVLQQIDGNVIKPKVFGEGVGLPSFWVMFSIILGGGLFGIIGMILAVPVFAAIYQYISYRMNMNLTRKEMSTELTDYMDPTLYDMRETKFKKSFVKTFKRKETKNDTDSKE